jgi:hypothetical protein
MGAPKRRTLVLLSLAAVASMALVPGPVTAGGGTSSNTSGVPLLVRIFRADPPKVAAQPADVDAPERAPAAPARKIEPIPSAADEVPASVDAVDPALLVRHVEVLRVDAVERADTPPPASDAPCPTATTCDRNLLRPPRWPTDKTGALTLAWRFNDEGRRNLRAPTGLLENAVSAGMAEWSKWNSNIRFSYEGTTTAAFAATGKDGSCDDGTNTVTWHQFDPSVIAAVGTCTDPSGKIVRDADLALNVTQHWEDIGAEPESRHSFDIRSIVTHELGHILSLLDLYDADSLGQTMMGNAEYGETRKRTLALGDIVGLQTAYPCGSGDTCPRKGIADD